MTAGVRIEPESLRHLRPLELPPLRPNPLVSVLISNYNYAHLAPTAIESLLSQTYRDLEVLLCDDGSTDNSLEVFERYAARDSRIKVMAKKNGGQATGFNLAFSHSHGDIICFLDTDDAYASNKVQRVVETFRETPEAGCVVNRLLRVDANRRPQGPLPLFARLPAGWQGPRVLRNGGILSDMPCTAGLNFRREVAAAMFPLPESRPLNMYPDMVMLRFAPLLTPIAAIQAPLAELRMHSRNTYMRPGLTADSIQRELTICECLWEAQRRLLADMDPELARELAPLDNDRGIAMERYMLARLAGDNQSRKYHRTLMRMQWPDRRYTRWFWHVSRYLPKPLFGAAINLVMTQNRWKQISAGVMEFFGRRPDKADMYPISEKARG